MIRRAWATSCTVALRTPYVLSFVTLEAVTARLVHIEFEDGRRGLGECVALPGYGCEVDEDIAAAHAAWLPELAGRTAGDARIWLHGVAGSPARPFALGAVLAAIDTGNGGLVLPPRIDHPLVAAIATADPGAMLERVATLRAEGYRTIKVKFGRDAAADAACVPGLLDGLPDDVRLRFDANQAYTPEEAAAVLAAFDHPRRDCVELFEQPLGVDEAAWSAFPALAASSPVPLMLDESIESAADVDRAAASGAAWIKLKQCKGAGARELLALAARARAHGMRVILGNGVATDVANLFEAVVRSMGGDLFDGAGEECGYVRLTAPLLAAPPRSAHGAMHWAAADGGGAFDLG